MVTALNDKAIAVEVSPIAFSFRIGKSERLKNKMFASCPVTSGFSWDLPEPGPWEILGKASELTEDQWKEIVEWFSILGDTGYQDYGKEYLSYGFGTAVESGQSLLKAKNVNPESVIILIKQ